MIFKDRVNAGNKLANILLKNLPYKQRKKAVIVSLLRGGAIVGEAIAKRLEIVHYPLVVTKISSPFNLEYAIGALCQDIVYFNRGEFSPIIKKSESIKLQIQIARTKNEEYQKKFNIKNINYKIKLKDKLVILVDDGIATGATVLAAFKFVKFYKPKQVILSVPVAPKDFNTSGFDKAFFLHVADSFSAVSQFYAYFPQVRDDEVKKLF